MINITEKVSLQGNCVLTPIYPTRDNYIGNSTTKEMEYAKSFNKEIIYYYDFNVKNN